MLFNWRSTAEKETKVDLPEQDAQNQEIPEQVDEL